MHLGRIGITCLAASTLVLPAQTFTTDYPAGVDWPVVTRPAGSIIAGAMHIDDDEFEIPVGPFMGGKFTKTVKARGTVDTLGYSGSPSTSTLANFEAAQAQLEKEGYKALYTCVRKACGGYQFAMNLVQPTVDTLQNYYGGFAIDTFSASTDDVRYAAFERGTEYLLLLTTLNPGKHSGLFLVDVGGKMPMGTPVKAGR